MTSTSNNLIEAIKACLPDLEYLAKHKKSKQPAIRLEALKKALEGVENK